MARYIDALEIRYIHRPQTQDDIAYKDEIDKIPTADVAPVVHGHWETIYNDCGHYGFEKCSACGDEYGSLTYRYCPSCGAKMDEEVNDG